MVTLPFYRTLMYVHLFPAQTHYSITLLKMLEEEIPLGDHFFIFGIGRDHPVPFDYPAGMENRILSLKNPLQAAKAFRYLRNARWIYIHLLAYDPTLLYWYLFRGQLQHTTWIVWGSDIYAYQKKNDSLRTRSYEWLRCRVIPRFAEIAAFVKEDYDLVASLYGTRAPYRPILYPLPVDLSHLEGVERGKSNFPPTIMIGNSGDPTNLHAEMLEMLEPFHRKDIKIVCPLAYGGTHDYLKSVITRGKELFGEKFIPWTEMMDGQSYAQNLSGVDIALMNHRRQQGLGNILALLYLGKKVFLRSDTTSWAFLKRHQCSIFDIATIRHADFEAFCRPLSAGDQTMANAGRIMTRKFTADLWKNLLISH